MSPEDPRHGTYAGAVQHWMAAEPLCDGCEVAARRYAKRRKAELYSTGQSRRVPSWRVRRRKEALQALGWTIQDIADAAGITFAAAWNAGKKNEVYRSTFEEIDRAYQQLHMARPEGGYATRTRNRALRNGFAPPMAWDDIDDPNEKPTGTNVCRIDHCQGATVAKGLCQTHYNQVAHRGRVASVEVDEVAVLRALGGDFAVAKSPETRAEVCRRWVKRGGSLTELRERAGWKAERYYRMGDDEEAA